MISLDAGRRPNCLTPCPHQPDFSAGSPVVRPASSEQAVDAVSRFHSVYGRLPRWREWRVRGRLPAHDDFGVYDGAHGERDVALLPWRAAFVSEAELSVVRRSPGAAIVMFALAGRGTR